MAASLIGVNGTSIATMANPVPVQLTTTGTLDNQVSFSHNDTTLDSFERLRVSEPRVAFEYGFNAMLPSTATTIWESTAYGAGTEALTTNLYGTTLITTVATATGRWLQSYNHIRYAPGISTLLRFTFNLVNPTATALRQRVGMFTDQGTFPSTAGDGFYFENDAGTKNFVLRYMTQGATGTEDRVAQAAWNMDKLNGTGISGVNLDWTKAQHLVVEFQYLGVGTIRFGFETGPAGVVWAHEMHTVNVKAEAWGRTGSLPVRAECYNYGASTINTLILVNCVVLQEGDVADFRGWKYFGGDSGATAKVGALVANTWYPVMGLRAAGTNDLTKRARIIPTSVSVTVAVVATGPVALKLGLLMLSTPNTSATFAVTVAGSSTVIDNAVAPTAVTTGTCIWNAIVPNVVGTYTFDLKTMNDNANVIGTAASGTQAITGAGNLMLCVAPMQTATVGASIVAAINWKEIV